VLVGTIAVTLNEAVEFTEQPLGAIPGPVTHVGVDDARRAIAAMGAIILRDGPEIAGHGFTQARCEHIDVGLVDKQARVRHQIRLEARNQRLHDRCGSPDPITKGRPINLDAMALEDLLLTIERQLVGIF